MKHVIRSMLPALVLAAMAASAQAQTAQDHDIHHPTGDAAPRADAGPTPQPDPSQQPATVPGTADQIMPMMGMMRPGGMMGGQGGMMMSPDIMRSMMQQMMGQQAGRPGTAMPYSVMGQMMGMEPMNATPMLPFEHLEGRLAFLKAELGVTEAQEAPWQAFADAIRRAAEDSRVLHEQVVQNGPSAGWAERLAVQEQALSSRLKMVQALRAGATPLYEALTEAQRQMADRLLSGPMGLM